MEALGTSSSSSGAGLLGSGGSGGLGSLMGPTSSNSAAAGDGEQSSERMTQLEREVSTLTNENLKLKELNQEVQ